MKGQRVPETTAAKTPQGYGYAVFGKVVEGKETVDKIKKVATGNSGGHQNVPTEAVVITRPSASEGLRREA